MSAKRPSGRFLIRMPADLHDRLRREAARRSTSLNSICVEILRSGVGETVGREAGTWTPWVDKARGLWGDGLVGVLLFGSVARGDAREGSDVDLLVALRSDLPITRALYRRWDDAEPVDERVNPHFAHPPSDPAHAGSLWIEVALDAQVLHDPAGALARSLALLRRELAAGRPLSRVAHGQRYWIHRSSEETDAQ